MPNSSACASPAPSDILEERAAELIRNKSRRQARLQSMDQESLRAEEVLKRMNSVTSSPIPTS